MTPEQIAAYKTQLRKTPTCKNMSAERLAVYLDTAVRQRTYKRMKPKEQKAHKSKLKRMSKKFDKAATNHLREIADLEKVAKLNIKVAKNRREAQQATLAERIKRRENQITRGL